MKGQGQNAEFRRKLRKKMTGIPLPMNQDSNSGGGPGRELAHKPCKNQGLPAHDRLVGLTLHGVSLHKA
jgi:hypothetical protein